jgi:asparagine synthase (glutamine-hydrolysing)
MCGVLCLTNVRDNSVNQLNSLYHRGPDFQGSWISPDTDIYPISIGHTRLSILDYSELANQPMLSSCGRYVIAFNGEIYNFQELKLTMIRDGHVFITESDTEVLLQGLIRNGHDFLNICNGMWSFILWDRVTGTLLFSRDRYGEKPLFYTKNGNGYVFSSEIKGLYPYISNIRYSPYIDKMFKNPFGFDNSRNTFLENVYRVPPGHFGIVKNGSIELKRWWCTLDHIYDVPLSYEEQIENFRELFNSSVKLRMISDAPTATMLSGGLDSSSVFSVMNGLLDKQSRTMINRKKLAFTSHFPESSLDELQWAEKAIEGTNIKLNVVKINSRDIGYKDLISALLSIEDPNSTLPIPMLMSYESVSKAGIKVTIDGHGADELFSGYNTINYAIATANLKETKEFAEIFKALEANSSHPNLNLVSIIIQKLKSSAYVGAKHIRDVMRGDEYLFNEDRQHTNYQSMDLFSKKLYELFHMTVLPTLLKNYDRYSMKSGVEIRMPFMDYRLVNYCFSLPLSSKLGGGYTKRILRDSMKGIVPDSILQRKDKIGWNAPLHEWLKGNLGREVLEQLNEMNLLNSKELTANLYNYRKTNCSNFIEGQKLWAKIQPLIWRDCTEKNWKIIKKEMSN